MAMGINWSTERWKVKDLKDYPHNPRTFTEKGMADLKASIKSLGYIDPIAINKDGTIIGGHARKQTLISLGLTEVEVRVPDKQLTEKQVAEAIIRLNKNTAGTWDYKVLEDSFEQGDLISWGFEKSEFNAFGASKNAPADYVPDALPEALSQLGDLWLLGDHRIMCGDATDAHAVSTLIGIDRPNLMVTDPPYGVSYDAAWRDRVGVNQKHQKRSTGKVMNDDQADWGGAWALFPGDVAYIWHADKFSPLTAESLQRVGFEMKNLVIWAKKSLGMGRGNYHYQHEPCWYAVRKANHQRWSGAPKQTTLWEIENMHATQGNVDDGKTNHSTQKPVECMRRPIENNTKPGEHVYEPFSGSGTTIIAAEITGRKCLAMELNPLYVDMAVIRWQSFTGQQAVHSVTNKPFPTPAKEAA